jgi:thymidylate synthase
VQQFHDNLRFILDNGSWKTNRTQYASKMVPGLTMRFDLRQGFPAVTTKRLAFKSVIGELVGFLRAARSAADFRALGCKVWDQNANENQQWLANPFRKGEDDLGDVYGAMWREWPAFKVVPHEVWKKPEVRTKLETEGWFVMGGNDFSHISASKVRMHVVLSKSIDMLGDCVRKILLEPDDRRILFHAWNPAKLDEMALPPCHLLYHFLPNKDTKELSLCMTQRSADYFLGIPFNIAEAALLLEIVAYLTGYKATWLTLTTNDSHIYENAIDATMELLTREPYPLPTLNIKKWQYGDTDGLLGFEQIRTLARMSDSGVGEFKPDEIHRRMAETAVEQLSTLKPEWFTIPDYQCHDAIKVDMAV